MSYPAKYRRDFDYQGYQNANPNRPLPGVRVNLDLNDLKRASDETIDFLKGITRSDGALANSSVGRNQLANGSVGYNQIDPDLVRQIAEAAVAAAPSIVVNTALAAAAVPIEGRITVQSGVPDPSTDTPSATSLYFTQDGSNLIPLYKDGQWRATTYVEPQLLLNSGAHIGNKIYDVFAFADPDRPSMAMIAASPAWATDAFVIPGDRGSGAGTAEWEIFDGVPVNKNRMTLTNGADTFSIEAREGRVLGSFVCASNGHTAVTSAKCLVSNLYNVRFRQMVVRETADSWEYHGSNWRQANGSGANGLFILSAAGGYVDALVSGGVKQDASIGAARVGIGVNSTTVDSSTAFDILSTDTTLRALSASFKGKIPMGVISLNWLESYANGSSTDVTWAGTSAASPPLYSSGISATVPY